MLNSATQSFPLKVLKVRVCLDMLAVSVWSSSSANVLYICMWTVVWQMEALMNLSKFEEAFALSNTLMRQNPNMANLLYWRAKCLYYMVGGRST